MSGFVVFAVSPGHLHCFSAALFCAGSPYSMGERGRVTPDEAINRLHPGVLSGLNRPTNDNVCHINQTPDP
jgi:hypothetical protein